MLLIFIIIVLLLVEYEVPYKKFFLLYHVFFLAEANEKW